MTLFDSFLANGTDDTHYNLRLADGQIVSIMAIPGEATVGVYLPDEITTPSGDAWEQEDHWEALLAAGDEPVDGRYFHEVPAGDVRKLIKEHGGEHADQSTPTTDRFDQAVTDGTGTGRRPMLRIRLADGEVIAVKTDAGDCHADVYLPEAIEPPAGDAWDQEERDLQLTRLDGRPLPGRLFYKVPATLIRALIRKHGGEHADQTNFA
ncbi:hypothetical protein [Streptomyces misionensis]|uniref:hypothetical protein n=1 Tax=Streptomyces misionensis TaxID=67331 RepID=UPI0033BFB228